MYFELGEPVRRQNRLPKEQFLIAETVVRPKSFQHSLSPKLYEKKKNLKEASDKEVYHEASSNYLQFPRLSHVLSSHFGQLADSQLAPQDHLAAELQVLQVDRLP